MDYLDKWNLMRKQSKEREKHVELVFSLNNPYGYRLNINHPEIRKKYEEYQKWQNLTRHTLREEHRIEFEEIMLKSNFLKKLLKEEEEKFGPAYEYIKRHGRWPDLEQQEDKEKTCVYSNQV